jgi:hypothetical protein
MILQFPVKIKSWPVISIIKKLPMSNERARNGLIKAFFTNNPSYALINSWSELESQVSFDTKFSYNEPKSKQIIDACCTKLSLSKSNKYRLEIISQKRNGVAHALGERKPPNWSDVLFVLRISRKYRK